jgi:hypothetical protein
MIKVSITKNNIVTNGSNFETQEEADAWIAQGVLENWWGLPQRWERLELGQTVPETALQTREVDAGLGSYTEYEMAAEYSISQEDITAQVQDEADSAKDVLADTYSSSILNKLRKINRQKIRNGLWDEAKVRSLKANSPLMTLKEDIRDGFFGIALIDLNLADVSAFYSAEEKALILSWIQQAHIATT